MSTKAGDLQLTNEIHPWFSRLNAAADVAPLFARYTNTKNRRGQRMTAAGMLVELNRLARHPFGKTLKAVQITNHVRTYG